MPKDEPVSLRRQTIFAIIPILDIYASYRVKRLRRYLLISVLVGIGIGIVNYVMFPIPELDDAPKDIEIFGMSDYGYDTNHIVAFIVQEIGFILFVVYLIRHWSKEWNKKFENS